MQQMQTGTSILLPEVICMHGHDFFFAFSFLFFGEVCFGFFLLFPLSFNPSHPLSVRF